MNFLFSFFYAPLVFFSLRYFDIQIVSSMVFCMSLLWFVLLRKQKDYTRLFPLFYMLVAVMAYSLNAFVVLKILPLLLATFFTLFILVSYLQGKSLILYFAEKFSKIALSQREKRYIHNATLFWFLISLMNVLVHVSMFMQEDLSYWLYYSTFGWYFLFLGAGLMQFVHRKYIFLRNTDV
ncbi:MAG: Putative membrane protein [uncultured Sulfurovum sp.]|uniref:Membrane protein n=1 Tax=uncultured Sulfurovum sp. TaxID=269237 RepID=A0A6S6T5Q1_9BACT|nr:MAG: Putative membrane protein [uncultured Sulfurovum sp.]